jgi:hypothetical protein
MDCLTAQQAVEGMTEAMQAMFYIDLVAFCLLPVLAVWFGYRLGRSEGAY